MYLWVSFASHRSPRRFPPNIYDRSGGTLESTRSLCNPLSPLTAGVSASQAILNDVDALQNTQKNMEYIVFVYRFFVSSLLRLPLSGFWHVALEKLMCATQWARILLEILFDRWDHSMPEPSVRRRLCRSGDDDDDDGDDDRAVCDGDRERLGPQLNSCWLSVDCLVRVDAGW